MEDKRCGCGRVLTSGAGSQRPHCGRTTRCVGAHTAHHSDRRTRELTLLIELIGGEAEGEAAGGEEPIRRREASTQIMEALEHVANTGRGGSSMPQWGARRGGKKLKARRMSPTVVSKIFCFLLLKFCFGVMDINTIDRKTTNVSSPLG